MKNDSFGIIQHVHKHSTTFGIEGDHTLRKNSESTNHKVSSKIRFTNNVVRQGVPHSHTENLALTTKKVYTQI